MYKINPAINLIAENKDNKKVFNNLLMEEYVAKRKEMNESLMFASSGITDVRSAAAYSAIYSTVSRKILDMMAAIDSIRYNYLVDTMVSQIVSDALAPNTGSDEIVRFSSKNPIIQKELDQLSRRIGLNELIENIAVELCLYGEYTLATKIDVPKENINQLGDGKPYKPKSKGLIDVMDSVDQGTVISLMQDGKISGYLSIDVTGVIHRRQLADYIKFQLGGYKIKANIDHLIPFTQKFKEKYTELPRFIRVGKSMFYSVIDKIKELELLDKLVPATKINEMSKGNLVGMNLPENYNLEDALTAVRRLEGIINKSISVDSDLKRITVESILSVAGKTKILPLFGDKGSLQNLDYRNPTSDTSSADAKDLRALICDSIGVPSELVFSSDGATKSEILKRYAKYLRKLKVLRKALSVGCKQMAIIHLVNKEIKFKESDIEVVFNNSLVEIDNLDKLEHADVTISMLKNIRDFFGEMLEDTSPYRNAINIGKVASYMEENLKTVGLADAVITEEEGGEISTPDEIESETDTDVEQDDSEETMDEV
jgi:hypothetical protein